MANTRRVQGSGSVYLRKDGRFAASATYEGKRITKYGKTKKEAWESLQTYLDELKQGKVVLGPKQTVKQYLEHWLEDSHRLKIELTTLADYRIAIYKHLIPAFGHLQLDKITKEHIQAFLAQKVSEGYAPGTVKKFRTLLSAALNDAVTDGVLAHNPCKNTTIPKQRKHKPHVLNKKQAAILVAAARGSRLWFLILMGLTTGARIGELLALRWSDIDINNLRVHIHRSVARVTGYGNIEKEPKTSSGVRKVVLTQVLIDAMDEQKLFIEEIKSSASSWEDRDLIFPNRHGRYMKKEQVLKELRVILEKAGLSTEVTMHDLRHSMATLLFAAGVNPKVIQEALGHSNISTTLGMYGDVLPDMQDQIGGILDQFFNES